MNNNYVAKAKGLLSEIGVHQLSEGEWVFTDVHSVNQAHINHSREPVALDAYSAVDATFAAGRFPGWALVDMVDKVPCMDGTEHTALAMVCVASIPRFPVHQSAEIYLGKQCGASLRLTRLRVVLSTSNAPTVVRAATTTCGLEDSTRLVEKSPSPNF
jgi:hypothetical protein